MVLAHLSQSSDGAFLWAGFRSIAKLGGAIDCFVRETVEGLSPKVRLWLRQSDGLESAQLEEARASLEGFEGVPVIATICTRLSPDMSTPDVVLLPLDDDFFLRGVVPTLNLSLPPWHEREAKLFWRGRCCGERMRIVERLAACSHTNVGFTDRVSWDHPLKSGWADPAEFARHKYVFIVDGNVIASSLMWCFALGAVPVLVAHPQNRYWFQSHLRPFENYVPVSWDLGDFDEVVNWLLTHDVESEAIAEAALRLAETLFSPEQQQNYTRGELERAVQLGGSVN